VRSLPDPATLRAAWWALRAVTAARSELRTRPFESVVVAAPPSLPGHAVRGVHAVLRRREPTCLERSLVLQRWLAAHGDPRDVIIGVLAPAAGFGAHAWLEGERPSSPFRELTRVAP
jgi:hypothetical protein